MESFSNTELRVDNPYSLGQIFRFNDGSVALDGPLLEYEASTADRYFTVIEGDDLWNISFQAYGNSKYYWVLQIINNIDMAADINIGDTLVIPDLIKLDLL